MRKLKRSGYGTRDSGRPSYRLSAWVAGAAVALGLSLGTPAEARIDVMLADGRNLANASVKPGGAPDQLRIEVPLMEAITVAAQDLQVIDFGKLSGRSPVPTARFLNGDQVFGKLSFPEPQKVRIAAGWGSMTVPLSWCAALRLQDQAAMPDPVSKDTLVLATDRVEGEIKGVTGGKVQLALSGQVVPLELSKIESLAFAARTAPPVVRKGLLLSLDLGGGERLTGEWVKLDEDLLTVRLDWGDTVAIPVASLSRLEVKNGKLLYLSDLQPSESRQIPYLDGSHPLRADLAVSGQPLRLGGRAYRRGLGMHSHSEVTYALDGKYETFAALLGIDDAVGAQGSVVYRVLGDEKLLFESAVVRGGDPAAEIKLGIKGVLLLRLEVDFADNGDVADHANWVEARLLRP